MSDRVDDEETYYHVDGEVVARADATVSVDDRGFRYGDAAFETCRAYGGTVFRWERHRERLRETCETLGMADAVPGDLAARVDETLAANDLADAYVRVSVSRGVQPGKLTPAREVDPTVVVYVSPLPRGGVDGEPVWDDAAVVQSVATRRPPESVLPPGAKTHNYLNGILARLELRDGGASRSAESATEAPDSQADRSPDQPADEALQCDVEGRVAEGATSNLFFVDDGVLKTPAEGSILPGITREVVLELAREEALPVETGGYRLADLRSADEAFLTNTTWEVRPVASIDGVEIGGGEVTAVLRRRYRELVEARCYGEAPG